jgi:hypothetical protein
MDDQNPVAEIVARIALLAALLAATFLGLR